MNQNEENQKLIEFWNKYFRDLKPVMFDKSTIKVESVFDGFLKYIGDNCVNVLDIGCGVGSVLMATKILGKKIKNGVGIDTSANAIDFAKNTAELSNISNLEFINTDDSYLDKLVEYSFDGIICSLDVIPYEKSEKIIKNITNILPPKGLLLLKLNFYLTDELISKIKMNKIDKNTYSFDGILRAVNLNSDEWISRFKGFKLLKKDEYQRSPNLPYDRIILLEKEN